MDALKRFGDTLKRLREAAGLSQQELAKACKMRQNNISRWERGEREPGWLSVQTLAAALGVKVNEFETMPAKRQPKRQTGKGAGEK